MRLGPDLASKRAQREFFNSVPWPGEGHPDAMKMSCRQGYFHTTLWNSANFALTEF